MELTPPISFLGHSQSMGASCSFRSRPPVADVPSASHRSSLLRCKMACGQLLCVHMALKTQHRDRTHHPFSRALLSRERQTHLKSDAGW